MVVLRRSAVVAGARQAVFEFLANFENSPRWDPGTLEASVRQDSLKVEGVGRKYDLVTIFKGTKSELIYETIEYNPISSVKLRGDGAKACAVDEIRFEDGPRPNTTKVMYEADIRVKGIIGFLFSPLLAGDFQKLADDAIEGITRSCDELFGTK
mmetsp:Transcript_53602/g.131317  ORF Transcript_53602/g.131317 Transcript_53602/m.131317 type:complete len:154 (-) Transcript_53602:99-560(-)|eukprot:CAMPEP_0198311636 /NCGR_PEP_ID=MMETSP1450-20131203/3297_1 /TAXON_ID=753684 ORGANISM="Madagascaria erythrocladiodes, Strain CCMP3234" /NCGR_SAMPLE_ID=MMETSP1450 /ASSEMBLY_ACC=CAM_ASM_001115 /LENGTH=153 /DNA_ID=CAMNT_0044014537 /DNA_START=79 /DNA_END=540 /DNA_ORIENTATION=-